MLGQTCRTFVSVPISKCYEWQIQVDFIFLLTVLWDLWEQYPSSNLGTTISTLAWTIHQKSVQLWCRWTLTAMRVGYDTQGRSNWWHLHVAMTWQKQVNGNNKPRTWLDCKCTNQWSSNLSGLQNASRKYNYIQAGMELPNKSCREQQRGRRTVPIAAISCFLLVLSNWLFDRSVGDSVIVKRSYGQLWTPCRI